MTSGGMKSVIIAAKDKEEAIAKVASQRGLVSLQLSAGVFTAVVPQTYATRLQTYAIEDTSDELDPTKLWLEAASDIERGAWDIFKDKANITQVERPIPFTKKGHTAIAVLVVSGEREQHKLTDSEISTIISGLYTGASALALSYPNDNITIQFEPHYIPLSPSSKVPKVGLSAWPSAVPFQNKLYCFYQGNKCNLRRIRFNVFNPTTGAWEGEDQVPATTITDGPSAVVYQSKLYVFHSGTADRHEIWYNVFDGTSWAGDARIPNTRITAGPSVVEYDGKLYCFHQGYIEHDNELWYNVYDGNAWVGDKLVTDTLISESPSAVVFKDKIYCFYQGVKELENTLLVNRFDPVTDAWSGHVEVPYTNSTTNGPSALAFDDKIYVFHQSGDEEELWFNTSTDGSLWRGDTPLTHERSTAGLGTTVFEDELYCFFQGADNQSLMYRSFAKGSLEWEDVWARPALDYLGYESYTDLAEAVRIKYGADNGYVSCVTKLPLLYNSYADERRLCIQYPTSDIGTTFAKIFDATGVYDRASDPSSNPRYTFAINNTDPVTQYAKGFVFHQGAGANSGTQLWFSLLDRRTGNWTEMQGPVTSPTTGGHAGVFLSASKLYIFYQVDQNGGELYYNILDQATWTGETKVPNIKGATGSPGAVFFTDKIHCFYQGYKKNGELWHNVLNTETDTWEGETQLQLQPDEFDGNTLIFHTHITLGPSSVVFRNDVHSLYNGAVLTPQDNGVIRFGRLRVNLFNGSGAISDMQIPDTYLTAEPCAVVYDDKIYAFHQGNNSDGTVWYNVFPTGENFWHGDTRFPLENGLLINDGPAGMALEGKLYCFLCGKGKELANRLWYNVLDGSNTWGEQQILPTGSGIGSQHDALAIGSLAIIYDNTPPTIERKI